MRSVKDLNLQSMSVIKGKEIEEVYSDWKKALMCNDLAFLEQVYSDDFTLTNSTGIIKNKSEVLTRLGFKDIQYLFWEDKDVLIDIKGDNAILKSYQTLNIELYNLPIKIDRKIILTFEKRNDVWILKNIEESSN
ncbi:MAG: nuclear transport factor 2 family protein [Segetibacter sp.]